MKASSFFRPLDAAAGSEAPEPITPFASTPRELQEGASASDPGSPVRNPDSCPLSVTHLAHESASEAWLGDCDTQFRLDAKFPVRHHGGSEEQSLVRTNRVGSTKLHAGATNPPPRC